ncbi:MAG TPA: carboxypeptidase-like regulatory domain-containing protein, partial [Acidobacteriota bacterium]|nr:carboxypeptidase-like regulatory domain-containing protein [Acidobacteriota bacterium]
MSSRAKTGLGLLLICSLWFIGAAGAWAQSDNGSISGFVRDQSGAVIPNAPVTVRNMSGLERKTNTSDSGYFIITNVPPGTYSITVEVAGFKVYQSTNNKLDPSSTLSVEIALTVGELTQTVSVSASAAALQTESATVQKLVSREQIDGLELNGRNPIFMANLVPGARGGNLSGLSFNFSQGPANFNGSRNPENLITYDGAPATRTR